MHNETPITPGRYSPTKRNARGHIHHVARVVTGVGNGWVRFYPEGQETQPMETPVSDWWCWAEITRAVRG